jgi:hypothetical protein
MPMGASVAVRWGRRPPPRASVAPPASVHGRPPLCAPCRCTRWRMGAPRGHATGCTSLLAGHGGAPGRPRAWWPCGTLAGRIRHGASHQCRRTTRARLAGTPWPRCLGCPLARSARGTGASGLGPAWGGRRSARRLWRRKHEAQGLPEALMATGFEADAGLQRIARAVECGAQGDGGLVSCGTSLGHGGPPQDQQGENGGKMAVLSRGF